MTKRILLALLLTTGCGAANANDPDRRVNNYDNAIPPARTSMDESDGPTQPRTSPQRPPGHGFEEE